MAVRAFRSEDIQPLAEILGATGVFRVEEIDVAVELMQVAVNEPRQQDYLLYTAIDSEEKVQGYYCVGPTQMTDGAYDLYWIAVDPSQKGKGVGAELIQHCETLVRSMKGRLILAETSSQEKYKPTHAFYIRNGYREEARIRDYYSTGDDLVVFTKHIKED
jgi:ribosomal protein S18 acetylase RimI-like enzyme